MAPVFNASMVVPSSFTDLEQKLIDACKDNTSSGTCIDCKSLGTKPFQHSDTAKRKLVLDQVANFYNGKVLDGTLTASHLVCGHRDSVLLDRSAAISQRGVTQPFG